MGIHWLEIAEYITIAAVWVSLVVAIVSNQPIFALFFVPLALSFNLLNRLRLEVRSSRRIGGAIKQLQQKLSEEVKSLEEKIQGNPFPSPKNTSPTEDNLIGFQQELASLDQAIKSIIQYLNNNSLVERLQYLEAYYNQLRAEITHIARNFESVDGVGIDSPRTDIPSFSSHKHLLSVPDISWQELQTIVAHTQAINILALSPDNKYLISGSWDRTVKIWSLPDGELVETIYAHNQGILALSLIPFNNKEKDNYYLVTGGFDQNIKVWKLAIDEEKHLGVNLQQTITNHTGSIHALAIAEKSKILISGSYDQTVKQWDITSGKMLASRFDDLGAIAALALHEERELIAGAGGDGGVTLWKLGTGEPLGFLAGNLSSVESLTISPDGQILAAGCVDGNIRIWYLEPRVFELNTEVNPDLIIAAHAGQVSSLSFTPDGQFLLSSGADGKVKVWIPEIKNELVTLLVEDENRLLTLALSADGKLLATGGVNGIIKVWHL